MEPTLEDLRKSIDNIDAALCALYAERFRITEKVGLYKKLHHLPPIDAARERRQFRAIAVLARRHGLDPAFAQKLLRLTIDEVVQKHTKIMEKNDENTA